MSGFKSKLALAIGAALIAGSAAAATTYTDNFTGTKAALNWVALNYACLTAGNGSGSIPACNTPVEKPGTGALRLTPAQTYQTGAILSDFTFPMSQGLQVTFTTYTYGGSNDGIAGDGADGISFFMTDGTKELPPNTGAYGSPSAGATGGALGYDCSSTNTNPSSSFYNLPNDEGVAHAYLGLGIDEWGNFLNSGDNGSEGIYNTNYSGYTDGTKYGTNSYQNNVEGMPANGSGREFQPQRIGLRGGGNTTWQALQALNPAYYAGNYNSSNSAKVREACKAGMYVASVTSSGVKNWKPLPDGNYNPIPGGYYVLPTYAADGKTKLLIANESATTRNPPPGTPVSKVPWPITYKLTMSSAGILNFSFSYNNGDFQPVLSNLDIADINGTPPPSFRFGFSAGTGGSDNIHEITCFQASPLQANASAGSNTVPGKRVDGNIQFFLPAYSENNWWGSLQAVGLQLVNGQLQIAQNANWDAKCVLTGAAPCDTMTYTDPVTGQTVTHDVPVQAPADRTLMTSTSVGAGAGTPLEWANLSQPEQDALGVATSNADDPTPGQNRVEWLRGDRAVEQLAPGCTSTPTASPPCDLRARTYVLGDIINSSPIFVGAPASGALPDVFQDKIDTADPNPENAAAPDDRYSAFVASNATRRNVVYVGSNDGFVHGFEAGGYVADANGNLTYDSSTNDGKEVFAYMPYDVLLKKAVNLADPTYKHDYLVDATPAAGNVFYAGKWHTWLVGGVGSTGQEIYALDVTHPTSFSASDVIGDWDNSLLTHLGNTVGTPVIRRMHDGKWAIIFGSGLVNPPAQGDPPPPTEGVYVGLIDPSNGSVTFKFLDTGVPPTPASSCPTAGQCPGGIAYVTPVDLDNDGIVDYLYAGDTQGNVWRFDVTGGSSSQWQQAASVKKVFVARDAAGTPQPITTAIVELNARTGLVTRAMLYFGTGQQMQKSDSSPAVYVTGQQTFYGIWDSDMAGWNAKSTTKYASLPSATITRNNLLAQTIQSDSDDSHRYLSTTGVVCWKGDAPTPGCSSQNQFGWMFDLPDKGPESGSLQGQQEQVIYSPSFQFGAVVVNTAIPPKISAAQCVPDQQTGWTMAFNPVTGGGFAQGFFQDAGGGFSGGAQTVGGTKQGGVGTPSALQYGGESYLVTQTVTGAAALMKVNPQDQSAPARVSWRELVN